MGIREWLGKCPLIAILRGIQTFEVEDVFSELLAAGVYVAEIPLNSPEAMKSIHQAAELFGGRMLVGAGTVTHTAEVEQVHQAGAKLIVSPHADAEIVRAAKHLKMCTIPGFGTATEAFAMVRAGADALKMFPADVLGPRMMIAMRAVLPKGTLMVPVSGIDENTIPMWREAGADGYGAGAGLYKPGATGKQTAEIARRMLARLKQS